MLRTKFVRAGDWRTLESFWNATSTGFFKLPPRARIKVRYGGGGWFGYNSQQQTLDGIAVRKLSVGKGSLAYARMQVNVERDGEITYDVYPGSVAQQSPEFRF